MPEVEQILWRDLTGNRFSIGFDPAMLSDAGYIKTRKIRRIGDPLPTVFKVKYDKDYLIERTTTTLIRPLFSLGKEHILELVAEAWDKAYPNATEAAITRR